MKNCLIVINTHKEESLVLGKKISDYLSTKDIVSSKFSFDGFSEEYPFEGYDFVVTLGGDGTVLFAARGCAKLGIPVFPVNLGEFGFIASVQKEEWKRELDLFLAGGAKIVQRSLIGANIISAKDGQAKFSAYGLNDIVVSAKNALRTIMIEVSFNYVSLGKFKADGIIISTPTGSTAYSSSAGGPIIDPELDSLLLTPINSFSLSSRPLVLSPKGEVELKILPSREHESILTIDGQKPIQLHDGDYIKIRQLPEKVKLVACTAEKFYEALQSKLNWSGGPHA
ncbi:MAG: NAD(+)/NADH kinase [Treponema sp.]|nr:NAD(+)/NADH kinase [Treponema sp.]